MRYGIDSCASPSVNGLRSHGADFVIRYVSSWGNPKNITLPEAQRLSAGGIDIVIVAEWGIDTWLGGYDTGRANAITALDQAVAVGMPLNQGRVIYFAVDDDVTLGGEPTSQRALGRCAALKGYLQGCADGLAGRAAAGCYSSYFGLDWLYHNSPLVFGWNTLAWSGGNWHPRAALRQETFNVFIDGINCDGNHSFVNDFGQWRIGGPVTPGVQVLRLGDQGAAVTLLQQDLNKLKTDPQLTVDGDFGPATDRAVRVFQTFLKTAVDGVVGEQTWNGLHYFLALATSAPPAPVKPPVAHASRYANEPVIKIGATGSSVKDLQTGLNIAFGSKLIVDGNFGSLTDGAVRAFQVTGLGGPLTGDGVVSQATWNKLDLILFWQNK
jgi:peptidoglycan hydrolase-like protein with peptidoglycan-binding domain